MSPGQRSRMVLHELSQSYFKGAVSYVCFTRIFEMSLFQSFFNSLADIFEYSLVSDFCLRAHEVGKNSCHPTVCDKVRNHRYLLISPCTDWAKENFWVC